MTTLLWVTPDDHNNIALASCPCFHLGMRISLGGNDRASLVKSDRHLPKTSEVFEEKVAGLICTLSTQPDVDVPNALNPLIPLLENTPDGQVIATVLNIPDCHVTAATRDQALTDMYTPICTHRYVHTFKCPFGSFRSNCIRHSTSSTSQFLHAICWCLQR
jgi:hypothetical protein